jgi:glycosyltransferase involved in cell wall biosynthesis
MTPPLPRPVRVLSVVIPVYNEPGLWQQLVQRIRQLPLGDLMQRQIIIVEDGSTDGTRQELLDFQAAVATQPPRQDERIAIIFHQHNRGKGAALRTGFAAADGDAVIVQDADLEYDPADYDALIAAMNHGHDVVYGSRFMMRRRKGHVLNRIANRLLTGLFNLVMRQNLTDMETCYKLIRRDVLSRIALQQDRFGFEPEITARIARLGIRIFEVPVSYSPRTRAQGKKIGFRDGLDTIWCIVKYGMRRARDAAAPPPQR